MSRSGYVDDMDDTWALIKWRGQVASAIRGKRGQSFLRELIAALDAMPAKRLIAHDLEREGNVCAIGSVGARRGVDMSKLDPEDPEGIAGAFGIAHQLVQEIEYMNDEAYFGSTPEGRWQFIRAWAVENLRDSGRLPKGEDSRSEAECEASQSGGSEASASPEQHAPSPPRETDHGNR